MVNLVRVADGAYPQPDYSFLPPDVKVWIGYLGGFTAHAWTDPEIAEARAKVGDWWGTWTAPNARALTAMDGRDAAAGCLAKLVSINYPTTDPVFMDQEYAAYVASVDGAAACFAAFATGLAGAGYRNTHWYCPYNGRGDWWAHWNAVQPMSLPAGVVGEQYDHALAGDRYDVSVFDLDLIFGGNVSVNGPEKWDTADWAAVRANLPALANYNPAAPDNPSVATVLHILEGIRDGAVGFDSLPSVQQAVTDAIATITTATGPSAYSGTITLHAGTQ